MFPSWRKKGAPDAPPLLQSIGRRLLANLQRRREIDPSVKSHSTQVELADGTVVRAQFVGDHPIVTVVPGPTPAAAEQPCTIVMESGCLDLGTNTATFGLPPTFNGSEPVTLHMGGTVDCDAERGLTRSVSLEVQGNVLTLRSSCSIPDEPIATKALDAAEFRGFTASTAEKRACQAHMQPSLWTGLMRRYVQALYGAQKAAYKKTIFAFPSTNPNNNDANVPSLRLPVAGSTDPAPTVDVSWRWSTWQFDNVSGDATWGLARVAPGDYRFLVCTQSSIVVRKATPTRCGVRLQEWYRRAAAAATLPALDLHRIEAFLLSTLLPGPVLETVAMATATGMVLNNGGWMFNSDGSEIAAVTYHEAQTQVRRRALTWEDGGLQIEVLDGAPEEYPHQWDSELDSNIVNAGYSNLRARRVPLQSGLRGSGSYFAFPTESVHEFDAAVFCAWDNDDELIVTRHMSTIEDTIEGRDPYDEELMGDQGGDGVFLLYPRLTGDCATSSGSDVMGCLAVSAAPLVRVAHGFYNPSFTSVQLAVITPLWEDSNYATASRWGVDGSGGTLTAAADSSTYSYYKSSQLVFGAGCVDDFFVVDSGRAAHSRTSDQVEVYHYVGNPPGDDPPCYATAYYSRVPAPLNGGPSSVTYSRTVTNALSITREGHYMGVRRITPSGETALHSSAGSRFSQTGSGSFEDSPCSAAYDYAPGDGTQSPLTSYKYTVSTLTDSDVLGIDWAINIQTLPNYASVGGATCVFNAWVTNQRTFPQIKFDLSHDYEPTIKHPSFIGWA
jgi:hypothetical protein